MPLDFLLDKDEHLSFISCVENLNSWYSFSTISVLLKAWWNTTVLEY